MDDDIEYYPTLGLRLIPAPVMEIGDEVRICDESGQQIATGRVIETYDGGATLKTISMDGD